MINILGPPTFRFFSIQRRARAAKLYRCWFETHLEREGMPEELRRELRPLDEVHRAHPSGQQRLLAKTRKSSHRQKQQHRWTKIYHAASERMYVCVCVLCVKLGLPN